MEKHPYESAAQRIRLTMPKSPCAVIIGSTTFWDPESEPTCQQIGVCLAEVPNLTLATGGMSGVGDTVGRSFYAATRAVSGNSRVVHLLPVDCEPRPYGVTLYAGDDMRERREILGRIAGVYIVVEGGPGTQHEAAVAQSCGATIIPVGRSGGAAAELYNILPCPPKVDGTVWSVLNEVSVHPRKIAQAVSVLVLQLLQLPGS